MTYDNPDQELKPMRNASMGMQIGRIQPLDPGAVNVPYHGPSIGESPMSEIEQELLTYGSLVGDFEMALEQLASRLKPVLGPGIEGKPSPDMGVPRNSSVARNLNDNNSRFDRLVRSLNTMRMDVQL